MSQARTSHGQSQLARRLVTPQLMGRAVRQPVDRMVERPRRRLPKALWVGGVAAFALSCESPLVPDREPTLVGEIVAAGRNLWNGSDDEVLFQVHVKATPDEECGIILTVHVGTRIVDSRGGEPRLASVDTFTEGALVAAWYRYVLDSCPAQSWAQVLERRE